MNIGFKREWRADVERYFRTFERLALRSALSHRALPSPASISDEVGGRDSSRL